MPPTQLMNDAETEVWAADDDHHSLFYGLSVTNPVRTCRVSSDRSTFFCLNLPPCHFGRASGYLTAAT